MEAIRGIRPFVPIEPVSKATYTDALSGAVAEQNNGFKDLLNQAISAVNATGENSNKDAISIMTGQSDAPHNILISGTEAQIALDLTLQVRNKIIDAYTEVMRMQI